MNDSVETPVRLVFLPNFGTPVPGGEGISSSSASQSHLSRIQTLLLQARAARSLSASFTTVAFWYCSQAKSHSLSPPWAMALQ